jgi:lysophospholipase L1-like esterase
MTLLSATSPGFRHDGRFDWANPAQPVVIWAGSRVTVDFEGDGLVLIFGQVTGQVFFNVAVDGVTGVADASAGRWVWPRALSPGWHRLELFKRTEADAGHVVFRGIEVADGARIRTPAVPAYRLRMEFIGDSITVGANNEDGAVDQWEDRRTHNHALSYGFLTAQALVADHRAVAVSGMGICEGFVEMKAGEVWDKIYPRAGSPRADLTTWVPDVVLVNLGENDDAFTRANGRPFPAGYTAGYGDLIKAVRAGYPAARIVLLRGGMWGGARSPELRAAWETAVRVLEAGDPAVSHFVFTHWSEQHPRVSDHRIMAGELTMWLKAQGWMGRWLGKTNR